MVESIDTLERSIQLELLYSYLPDDVVLLENIGVVSNWVFVLPVEVSLIEKSFLDLLDELEDM